MTKEKYTEEDKRKYLLLQCRYYNGEDENPFAKELCAHEVDKSHLPPPECMKYEYKLPPEQVTYLQNASTAWGYEKWWVDANLNNFDFKGFIEEYHAYGCKGFEENDGTPLTMKAMFWNRYYHWGGMLDPQSTEFKEWYKSSYQKRETNLQRRTKQRMVELTAKCRFYKGEKENPLANTEDEMMWYYERVWVERLAQSYTNADSWNRELKLEHLDHLPKKYGIPSSLVGLLLNRYMHWGNPYHPSEGFENWLKFHYMKNKYLKSQECLQYTYEHAKARMKAHPEHAAKQKQIIREHPYFRSEKKALITALRLMKKKDSDYQIWAKINKDEEYYRIQNYWLVSDNGITLSAAEYIGMAQIYTIEMLEKILRKNIDVDEVIAGYQVQEMIH